MIMPPSAWSFLYFLCAFKKAENTYMWNINKYMSYQFTHGCHLYKKIHIIKVNWEIALNCWYIFYQKKEKEKRKSKVDIQTNVLVCCLLAGSLNHLAIESNFHLFVLLFSSKFFCCLSYRGSDWREDEAGA